MFYTDVLIALAWLLVAAVSDVLVIRWHKHREDKQPLRAANTGILLAAVGWFPLIVLITTHNWLVIVADLVGNWIGSYIGVGWYSSVEGRTIEDTQELKLRAWMDE